MPLLGLSAPGGAALRGEGCRRRRPHRRVTAGELSEAAGRARAPRPAAGRARADRRKTPVEGDVEGDQGEAEAEGQTMNLSRHWRPLRQQKIIRRNRPWVD